MRTEKLHGVILKRTNFQEADKSITIFTLERGKTKVVAKGIRRIKSKRAPHLELFTTAEIMIHSNIVTEAKSLKTLEPDLKSIGYLFYISEVLDKLLPEEEPHREVYTSLQATMDNLSEASTKQFVVTTLWELGYLPRGEYPQMGITSFVEQVVERPIKSKKFLEEL